MEDHVPIADTITSTGMVEDNQGPDMASQTTGVEHDLDMASQTTGVEHDLDMASQTTGVEHDLDMASQTTGVEHDLDMASQTTGVEHSQDKDDGSNTTPEYDSTEEAEYEKAEQLGIESAHNDNVPLPKRIRKKKADEIYEYYNALFVGIDVGHVFLSYDDEHTNQVFSFLTDQMSVKAGLKEFGEKGAASIMQELEQLLYWKVIVGRKASSLTSSQRKATLQYLMFLKEK